MRTILKVALFLLLSINGFGQNQNIKRTWHWYFGHHAGIDFSSGVAISDTSGKIDTQEGCSVISDTSGNLLLYTDGTTVWDRNHDTMPNGKDLMGCGNLKSTSQAALIVPLPNSDSLYYIFTNDCSENQGAGGFRYSIISINRNGGLGDVILKNHLLFAPSSEKTAAVFHANQNDVWILTHENNNNNFRAYLLKSSGIDTIPIISLVGSKYKNSSAGCLKFSPNGKMVAAVSLSPNSTISDQFVEMYKFDSNTGTVFSPLKLDSTNKFYGISFSPDNSKIYISNPLYQFDLCSGTASDILASKTLISLSDAYPINMSLSSDGKIYVARIGELSLGMINDPDLLGLACNYV
jgi:DNA-binding beta-propeller fold protein YncE